MSANCNSLSLKLTLDDLAVVPGGEFLMGQENGRDDERPAHRVRVRPFLLGRTQVTNAQYGSAGDPDLPMTSVSWFDAIEFCAKLGEAWRCAVRLPTEAEWEFAARGGVEGQLYPWGDELAAIVAGRWKDGPSPVAQDAPNAYGLYDICQ